MRTNLILFCDACLLLELQHAPQLSQLLEDLELRALAGLNLLMLQHLKALQTYIINLLI